MVQNVVIAINKLNPSAAQSLLKLAPDACIVVLRDKRVKPQNRTAEVFAKLTMREVETDYFDASRLDHDIAQFRGETLGVVSRGESSIQYLAKLSDACQGWGLALPSSKSLEIATDKERMRQAFYEYCPDVSPAFLKVVDASDETIQTIEQQLGYPVIIKPANLASSLLIQRCDTLEELRRALEQALTTVRGLYEESGRYETPTMIVEQMLEGDLYSVDTYVLRDGTMWHCPPISYVTGQSIGVDDFFLYKRSAPAILDQADWLECQRAVEAGIAAIGLRSTTAHIELCRTYNGWKIIEIGPRVGRYRIEMYREVYGVEHSDNDVRVRLGEKPIITDVARASCAVYSIYPATEGVLKDIQSIDQVEKLPSLTYLRRLVNDGMVVKHAKHGGHALAEVILSNKDLEQFKRDCVWLEENVKAYVQQVGGAY